MLTVHVTPYWCYLFYEKKNANITTNYLLKSLHHYTDPLSFRNWETIAMFKKYRFFNMHFFVFFIVYLSAFPYLYFIFSYFAAYFIGLLVIVCWWSHKFEAKKIWMSTTFALILKMSLWFCLLFQHSIAPLSRLCK